MQDHFLLVLYHTMHGIPLGRAEPRHPGPARRVAALRAAPRRMFIFVRRRGPRSARPSASHVRRRYAPASGSHLRCPQGLQCCPRKGHNSPWSRRTADRPSDVTDVRAPVELPQTFKSRVCRHATTTFQIFSRSSVRTRATRPSVIGRHHAIASGRSDYTTRPSR